MAEEPRPNVFVLGLTEFQRGELETITNAANMNFHQLLAPEVVTRPEAHGFGGLLERARAELRTFDGTIDAIIAHWDFPSSVLMPILCAEWGMPAPPLEAVVTCEHKYWSRLEQAASVLEVVPAFAGFDPFDHHPFAAIDLDCPFWVKPVKAHSSQLGFRIETAEQFEAALGPIREKIGRWGKPFNEVLALVDLPEMVSPTSGLTCLAEQIVSGYQVTVEGTMFQGDFDVHGVVDSPKDEQGRHFARYEYPSRLADAVQQRMVAVCERFLRHIGYDDGCWNTEFMWDEARDQLWLIEVNTRISQSHSDLFAKVDGMSNHEVAVDIALGSPPRMPQRRGNFEVAAKCFLWTEHTGDGVVKQAPTRQDVERVEERFPGTHVEIWVEVGDRLSELEKQSTYRYDLGAVFLGAQDHDELVRRHDACREMLTFEIDPVEG